MTAARTWRRASFRVLLATLAASGAVGCGASSDRADTGAAGSGSGGVAATGGQAMVDAQAALARCMRRQGVNVPDPGSADGSTFDPAAAGVSEAELREAEAKCERERRALAEAAPRLTGADRRRAVALGLRYARCMRAQGQDVPDPSLSDESGGTAVELPGDAKSDPAFQAATKRCDHILREGELP